MTFRAHAAPGGRLPVTAAAPAMASPRLARLTAAVDFTAWAGAAESAVFRWVHALVPSSGREWSLLSGTGFAAELATFVGPVPWVWAPNTTAVAVRVGVYVRDVFGAVAGPFWATEPLTVARGACAAACGVTLWDDPLRHAACLWCGPGIAPSAEAYVADHVIPALRPCTGASQWQLLDLLNTAAQYLTSSPTLDPTQPATLSLLTDLVAAAAACPAATAATDRALLALLDAVLLPRARPADAYAVVRMLALLDARVLAREDGCMFQAFAYATPGLALRVQRVAKNQIPAMLEVALTASVGVMVSLPPGVAEVVARNVTGDTVDIVQYAIAGFEGLPAPVFTLAFRYWLLIICLGSRGKRGVNRARTSRGG